MSTAMAILQTTTGNDADSMANSANVILQLLSFFPTPLLLHLAEPENGVMAHRRRCELIYIAPGQRRRLPVI
jgi:hypothetical protein